MAHLLIINYNSFILRTCRNIHLTNFPMLTFHTLHLVTLHMWDLKRCPACHRNCVEPEEGTLSCLPHTFLPFLSCMPVFSTRFKGRGHSLHLTVLPAPASARRYACDPDADDTKLDACKSQSKGVKSHSATESAEL